TREFVTRDGLYKVLYEDRPECEWPEEKILDVQICKLEVSEIGRRPGQPHCRSRKSPAPALPKDAAPDAMHISVRPADRHVLDLSSYIAVVIEVWRHEIGM